MLIDLLQINTTAGDTKGNAALIMRGVKDARNTWSKCLCAGDIVAEGYNFELVHLVVRMVARVNSNARKPPLG
jgi:hypothetical protein